MGIVSKHKKEEVIVTANVGGYCYSYLERVFPKVGNDVVLFYRMVLRAIMTGVIPEEMIETLFDWKKIIKSFCSMIDGRLMDYDRVAYEMRYDAVKLGPEFLEWFDEDIIGEMMVPKRMVEKQQHENGPGYATGKQENGSLILDASEYGVTDIAGAVNLFAKLTEL